MAKFRRFDPRNKKANSHKSKSKSGFFGKKIHKVASDEKELYDESKTEDLRAP
jgi:hypothetical protein